jgi:hypothetical protein
LLPPPPPPPPPTTSASSASFCFFLLPHQASLLLLLQLLRDCVASSPLTAPQRPSSLPPSSSPSFRPFFLRLLAIAKTTSAFLRFAFCVLRFAFCVLRFAFCVWGRRHGLQIRKQEIKEFKKNKTKKKGKCFFTPFFLSGRS